MSSHQESKDALGLDAASYADRFIEHVAASPSSYHAAALGAEMLSCAGFQRLEEDQPWQAAPGGYFVVRGGALIAWVIPEGAGPTTGFRILGSHTDSPGLKLKVAGDIHSAGWHQAGVEIYGGPILASWLDRDLRLAGRVVLDDASTVLVTTEALLRVPHLAIHLDREANTALKLDRQRHMQPVLGLEGQSRGVLDYVAAAAGIATERIVAHDLITADTQRGERIGAQKELLACGRLDNLASFFPSLDALIAAKDAHSDAIMVAAGFDHEEVGSNTTSGAAGPLLRDVLERTQCALGADLDQRKQAFARSSCVSADVAHAVHPNYSEKHDAVNAPAMGQGPAMKVNAQARYASDAVTEAVWLGACKRAGVHSQVFVGNNAMPCGSTIGPISATRLGIPTVDVGIPILSMHSARELAHIGDLLAFSQVARAYLVG